MGKADEYLKILYPDPDSLTGIERKKYEQVKEFLEREYEYYERTYQKYIDLRGNEEGKIPEPIYSQEVLAMCRREKDVLYQIEDYVDDINSILDKNPYISNNFEDFMKVMAYERKDTEKRKDVPLDATTISLQKVAALTREFLQRMDPSGEMLNEFNIMALSNRIRTKAPDKDNTGSNYTYDGKIEFCFDGTVNTAHALLHEFMHAWTEKKGHITRDRETHTMFNEYESLYYELAFMHFMDEKGLLPNGVEPLKAKRSKFFYSKDESNCVMMLLELGRIKKEKGMLEKQDIIDIARKYGSTEKSDEKAYEECSELLRSFIDENIFPDQAVSGPIMYRFNYGLALQTPQTLEAIQNIHKLSSSLSDRSGDHIFMLEYLRTVDKIRHPEKVEGIIQIEEVIDKLGPKGEKGLFSKDD